ncbi:MAG: hypothetical protein QMD46_12670 [Methanomicrobiales archaeon]|nr:hypothetical protein [Methanomicrobiales archaeon]
MLLDWFVQQGRNVRQALIQKRTPVQTPAPTRQTAVKPVQPVQELKKALAPKPIQQPIAVRPVQPKQGTPQDITKPIYDAGVGASQWWKKNAAPAITQAIDSLPYLGPRTVYRFEGGQIIPATAGPLTGGGTRLRPNWEGDIGHDLAKGAAVDLPQHTIEFVTAAPLGVERAARMALRDPARAAEMAAGGLVAVGAGTVQAAKENPARFTGEMAAGVVIGGKTAPLKQRAGATALRGVAHLDPYFERGMKVYTGSPGPIEAITRWQNPLEYHPTLRGSTKFELAPDVFEVPRSYYHGTSREFLELGVREGRLEVASHKPSAIRETRAAAAALERGKVEPAFGAVEHALFLGPPDTGYAPFSSGGFLKVRGTVRDIPDRLASMAKEREALRQRGERVPRTLQQKLTVAAYREYFDAPRGEILVSPKPISGYEWKGLPEHEYVIKPRTRLYPVHSGRSRFFQRFGMTRGSSYTIHPATGEILEIMEFSTSPVPQAPPPPILIDIPRIRAKLPSRRRRGSVTVEEVLAGPQTRPASGRRDAPGTRTRGVMDVPKGTFTVRPARQTRPTEARGSGAVRPDRASLNRAIRGPDQEIRAGRREPDTVRRVTRPSRPWEVDPRPPRPRVGGRGGGRPRDSGIPGRVPGLFRDEPAPRGFRLDEAERSERKKGRRRARDPYDWIVRNPVPDIEFSLGRAGSFDAPARQKGKGSSRRSPAAGPPADFFEVGGF